MRKVRSYLSSIPEPRSTVEQTTEFHVATGGDEGTVTATLPFHDILPKRAMVVTQDMPHLDIRRGSPVRVNVSRSASLSEKHADQNTKAVDVWDNAEEALCAWTQIRDRAELDAAILDQMIPATDDLLPPTWYLHAAGAYDEGNFIAQLRALVAEPRLRAPNDDDLCHIKKFLTNAQNMIDVTGRPNTSRLSLYAWPAANRMRRRQAADYAVAAGLGIEALALAMFMERCDKWLLDEERTAWQAMASARITGEKRDEERVTTNARRWREDAALLRSRGHLRPHIHVFARIAADWDVAAELLEREAIKPLRQRLDVIRRSAITMRRLRGHVARLAFVTSGLRKTNRKLGIAEGRRLAHNIQGVHARMGWRGRTEFGENEAFDVGFERPILETMRSDLQEAALCAIACDLEGLHQGLRTSLKRL